MRKGSKLNPDKPSQEFAALIEREGECYVSLCPELDIASQGKTVEDARKNRVEAIELFFGVADLTEIASRLRLEVFVAEKLSLKSPPSSRR
ncbi:MAG: type II toxin-antitoxin system HicB family antitoxin [Cyanobacteriota bacterium]|nr:type II toxin-antitoxin system HicB family antitoxin [Cyanobacteriota bacterium]